MSLRGNDQSKRSTVFTIVHSSSCRPCCGRSGGNSLGTLRLFIEYKAIGFAIGPAAHVWQGIVRRLSCNYNLSSA